jgi:hypothetical protein
MSDVLPAWARGHDLGELRALTTFLNHPSLVFGAFGAVKERDVADSLANEGLKVWPTVGEPQAMALHHTVKSGSVHRDFAQRPVVLPAGTTYVNEFAATSGHAGAQLLDRFLGDPRARLCVEIYEEDAASRAAVEDAGLFYAATKVMAGSEVKGLYFDFEMGPLPPEEVPSLAPLDQSFLSDDALAMVRQELEEYGDAFEQHYSYYNKRKSWTAFALQGFSVDPGFIIKPSEMSTAWKKAHPGYFLFPPQPRRTEAAPYFPKTLALLGRLPFAKERIRFMRLRAADGELTRHADITDREAGLRDGMSARLHIPIVSSDKVTFHGWGVRGEHYTAHWGEGSLNYLDQRKPHAVTNTGDVDRIHLVVDCLANQTLREWVARAPESDIS